MEAWQPITPTQTATHKRGSSSPRFKEPQLSVGVHRPNSKGHNEQWEPTTPTERGQ